MRFKIIAAAVAFSMASVGAASASMVSGLFNVQAVNVTNLNSTQSQATLANFNLARAGNLGPGANGLTSVTTTENFTFNGALDFRVDTGAQDAQQKIADWLATAGGIVDGLDAGFGGLQLSRSNINSGTAITTFFLFTLTTPLTAGNFTVTNDDGFAVIDDGVVRGGVLGPIGLGNPTTVTGFDGGRLQFLYVATNGNPSVLEVTTTAQPAPVPVPAALPMLLAAMGGLGWMARRRRAAA